MLDNVEKQLEVVEDEHRFVSKVIEGDMINSELLVSHEFRAVSFNYQKD